MTQKQQEIQIPVNTALLANITPQEVLDLPTYKFLFSMDGQSLKETTELFNLNEAQHELISSGQRGVALMKAGKQAVKIRFVLSEKRLEMFGRGGGR